VITNNLAYPFTKALYGFDIRQPIAGEYGLSKNLYEILRNHSYFPLDFGVDIFIVTSALANQMEIREGLFSLKIHESTTRYVEPDSLIVPMFRQVTGTMFNLAKYYEGKWRNKRIAQKMMVREFFGQKPIPVKINTRKIKSYFNREFVSGEKLMRKILPKEIMKKIEYIAKNGKNFETYDAQSWARSVYHFAAYYKKINKKTEKYILLDALKTLWLGRLLGYIYETKKMSIIEAEKVIQNQAKVFEEELEYFLSLY
jgi:hypothetical protein